MNYTFDGGGPGSAELLGCTVTGCRQPRADQDPKATNRHCKAHRAEGQRRWAQRKAAQQAGQSWVKGVEAMRATLLREFGAQGESSFTGLEIASLIKAAPGPILDIEEQMIRKAPEAPEESLLDEPEATFS